MSKTFEEKKRKDNNKGTKPVFGNTKKRDRPTHNAHIDVLV